MSMKKWAAGPVLTALLFFNYSFAAAASPDEAATLAERGWDFLNHPPSVYSKEKREGPPEAYYEPVCDSPQAAVLLFEKAVSLDAYSARGWLGWGQALERLALCPAGSEISWLEQRLGNSYYDDNLPKPRRYKAKPAQAIKGSYALAAEKYRKVVALEPDNAAALQYLAANLMVRVRAEENQGAARDLAMEAFGLYSRLAELSPEDKKPEALRISGQVRLNYLPYEPDGKIWADLLAESRMILKSYAELLKEGEGLKFFRDPATETIEMFKWTAGECSIDDREKRKAILKASIESQDHFKLKRPDLEEVLNLDILAQTYLSLASLEEDDQIWRQHIARAEELFVLADQKRSDDTAPSRTFMELLREAEAEKKTDRRLILVDKALTIMAELEETQWIVTDAERGTRLINPATARLTMGYFMAAYLLPEGEKKAEIIEIADSRFEQGLAQTVGDELLRHLLGSLWAGSQIRRIIYEDDPQSAVGRLAELEDKIVQIGAVSQYRNESLNILTAGLESAARTVKNPEMQKLFLKTIVNYFGKHGIDELSLIFDGQGLYSRLVNVRLRLALLSSGGPLIDDGLINYTEALIIQDKKLTDNLRSPSVPNFNFNPDGSFDLAQMMVWAYTTGNGRDYLTEALIHYRHYFNSLPDGYDSWPRDGWPAEMKDGSRGAQGYRDVLTPLIAVKVREVHQALMDYEMTDWDCIQMGGLLRFLLASNYLTEEYQALYRQRAEDYFQLVVNSEDFSPKGLKDPEKSDLKAENKTAIENRRYEKSLALTELGLLWAEKALAENKESGLPPRTRQIWEEAEKIRPGSSRYARARWAAWRGEREEMLNNLRHGQQETQGLLYPPFKAAVQDPAFADYKDFPYFKRAWYGLD